MSERPIRRAIKCSVLGLLFPLVALCGPAAEPADRPPRLTGIYALIRWNEDVKDETWKRDDVQGVVLRTTWRDLEPEKGRYDFAHLDRHLAEAARHGKGVRIIVATGHNVPEWLFAEVPTVAFSEVREHDPSDPGSDSDDEEEEANNRKKAPVVMAVPWDAGFLDRWAELVRVLGERYAKHPNLVAVGLTGPSGKTGEVLLPREPGEQKVWSGLVKNPEDMKTKMLGAWEKSYAALCDAFPKQTVTMALILKSLPIGDRDLEWSYKEDLIAMGMKRPGQFGFQTNGLNAKGRLTHWKLLKRLAGKVPTGFQVRAPVNLFSDGRDTPEEKKKVIKTCLAIAEEHKVAWLEIYESLIHDPGLAPLFTDFAKKHFESFALAAAGSGGNAPSQDAKAPIREPAGWIKAFGRCLEAADRLRFDMTLRDAGADKNEPGLPALESHHTVTLMKPGLSRIDTLDADGRVVSSSLDNGKEVWIIQPLRRTAMRFPSQDTPLTSGLPAPDRLIPILFGGGEDAKTLRDRLARDARLLGTERVGDAACRVIRSTATGKIRIRGIDDLGDPVDDVLEVADTVTVWLGVMDHRPRRIVHEQKEPDREVRLEAEVTRYETDFPLKPSFFDFVPPPDYTIETPDTPPASPQPGDKAPDFEATDLDGRPVRLSDFAGKAILLNFWTYG